MVVKGLPLGVPNTPIFAESTPNVNNGKALFVHHIISSKINFGASGATYDIMPRK